MALSSVALNSTMVAITQARQVGRFYLLPNTTYNNTQIDFADPFVVAAISNGTLVFNDGTNVLATWQSNPTVAQLIQNYNQIRGESVPGAGGIAPNPYAPPLQQ